MTQIARPPRLLRCLLVAAVASVTAACTVGPNYVRPPAGAPAEFKEAKGWKVAQPSDEQIRSNWWEAFGDVELNALVAQVQISNQNLKAAEARVREARAIGQQARAQLFPTVSGAANATRSGSGNNANRASTGTTSSAGSGVHNDYNLSLDIGWEIDLWGRIRRTIEAANANTQASEGDLQAATLLAQAELAQDYLLLRVQDATIALLQDTVTAFDKSAQLTRNQYAVGVAARADVVQAEVQLKQTQAQVIDAGIQRAQLEHAIALLIGKAPAELSIAASPMHTVFPDVPTGVPSALLERRPDIAAAERRAAAANAQIGVAEAAYYPDLTLSATGGFQSSAIGSLLTLPSRFWSLGPTLAQVIFDAGLRRAQTAQAVATYDENVANYRQVVLTAFQDVEDNLAALRILQQEASVQDDAVKASRESVTITTNQYKAGTANYLAVVIVQAAALNNERTALDILGRRLTASVGLIRALGGGWDASALTTAKS